MCVCVIGYVRGTTQSLSQAPLIILKRFNTPFRKQRVWYNDFLFYPVLITFQADLVLIWTSWSAGNLSLPDTTLSCTTRSCLKLLSVCSCQARFILLANKNAIQILTSQGCFRKECFAGVEHMSTDASYSLWFMTSKLESHSQEIWTGLTTTSPGAKQTSQNLLF